MFVALKLVKSVCQRVIFRLCLKAPFYFDAQQSLKLNSVRLLFRYTEWGHLIAPHIKRGNLIPISRHVRLVSHFICKFFFQGFTRELTQAAARYLADRGHYLYTSTATTHTVRVNSFATNRQILTICFSYFQSHRTPFRRQFFFSVPTSLPIASND